LEILREGDPLGAHALEAAGREGISRRKRGTDGDVIFFLGDGRGAAGGPGGKGGDRGERSLGKGGGIGAPSAAVVVPRRVIRGVPY